MNLLRVCVVRAYGLHAPHARHALQYQKAWHALFVH